jgi:hypothetical protein
MLEKWPNPNRLSGKVAPAGGLWIRRVLVGPKSPLRLEPRRGNWKAQHHLIGAGPSDFFTAGRSYAQVLSRTSTSALHIQWDVASHLELPARQGMK